MAYELERIMEQISRRKGERIQNLASAINVHTLTGIHEDMDGKKAVGIDGVSKAEYSEGIEEKLEDLVSRLKREAYKPKESRRVYIDKLGSNKKRPLGISCYEDKLVESAVATLLNLVYEPRFLDLSFGFRYEKNCHQAIKKIINEIQFHKVSYVVEADIKSFFDTINHDKLIMFLEHDIADRKFIGIIRKLLKAGVMEDVPVIAADTIVVVDGTVLGKPADEDESVKMLKRLQGRAHDVFTGVSVMWKGKTLGGAERTRVVFRALDDEAVRAYAACGEGADKAGAYAIQGKGALLVDSIEGDYFNVVGLPLCRLSLMIEEMGLNLPLQWGAKT